MGITRKYFPFLLYAILFCIITAILFPFFRYYIDPDGTAYLTIAQRYASGDLSKAINGYWSPWACWLTAVLTRIGVQLITASVIVNALAAIGFLWISISLFLRLGVNKKYLGPLCSSVAFFLCFAVYYQSFDDLWECFFLLSALRLLLATGYSERWELWLISGILGVLAYFSKAYALPFFILNTIGCLYFITGRSLARTLQIFSTIFGIMLLTMLPWLMLLHQKYGFWTTSTSGSLNTSWYLVGHPYWKPEYHQLLPPPYADSPYYWEDPYLANAETPHFWNSPALAFRQVLKIGQNLWKLLMSMAQISVVFPLVAILLVSFLFNKKARKTTDPTFILSLSFWLFPLGYLLVNFEQRYIWYMIPISMTGGILFLQNHVLPGRNKIIIQLLPYLFPITYMIYPGLWLSQHAYEGLQEYRIASQLKKEHIKGAFFSNAMPGMETQRTARLAYFSGNAYYASPVDHSFPAEEIWKYHIRYYLYYTQNRPPDEFKLLESNTPAFSIVYTDTIAHLKILQECPYK